MARAPYASTACSEGDGRRCSDADGDEVRRRARRGGHMGTVGQERLSVLRTPPSESASNLVVDRSAPTSETRSVQPSPPAPPNPANPLAPTVAEWLPLPSLDRSGEAPSCRSDPLANVGLRTGALVDRAYLVEKVLGVGGMGVVALAR